MNFSPAITLCFSLRSVIACETNSCRCVAVFFLALLLLGGCDSRSESKRGNPASQSPTGIGTNQAGSPDGMADGKLAQALLQQGEIEKALEVAQRALLESPTDHAALRTMASVQAARENFSDAARIATELAKLDGEQGLEDWLAAFDWHLRASELMAAEQDLREALRLAPEDPRVHRTMAQLLNAEGRRFESRQYILNLIRLNAAQPRELLSLVELGGPFRLVSLDEVVADPAGTLLELGQARYLLVADSDLKAALEKVNLLAGKLSHPALDAFRGRLIAETDDSAAFEKWLEEVVPGTDEHPEYWYAIGLKLARMRRDKQAIRAFGEALTRDPTDRASLRYMAAALERIGEAKGAAAVRENLAVLDQVFRRASVADASQAMWIGEQLQKMVRPWESLGWYQYAFQLRGSNPDASVQMQERRQQISMWEAGASEEAIAKARLDRMIGLDLSKYPAPSLKGTELVGPSPGLKSVIDHELSFRDIAPRLGIDVVFTSEYSTEEVDFFLYQANGGGLAAFDYDLDGRCDLYLVQTGGNPEESGSSQPNQFFRQMPGAEFQAIEQIANVADRCYGQGVCAGDINQDGFTDLIIANIGRNSVYLNQGDGTFRFDSTAISGDEGRWTSSVALADMNGDDLPDLIEVNYLNDRLIFERKCQGKRLDCTPQRFRAASDRIFENRGDGTFVMASAASGGMDASPNYGFGLIVTRFGHAGGNEVFVSNDGDHNQFWKSMPVESVEGARWTLQESAGVSGCSIGVSGISQACMGIAASDFDRNGRIDLGITNFHNEPMNLFLQNESGFFNDEALRFGLAQDSKDMLGFGAQAADYDNDGWPDLAVLNGHIYDATYAGIPFTMRPQLFRGAMSGFKIQSADTLPDYWQQSRLGRTLITLDWNRDGKMDLLANHLDQPLSLLENESESGNWVQFELVGTVSEREAIGARIEIEAGEERWTAWQIAGDGYMCTNESIIHLGLGNQKMIDKLTVHWPSSKAQVFTDVAINQRSLLIEGQSQILER